MSNYDIQAAWDYHNGTKHPSGRLLNPRHMMDSDNRPRLFKIYEELEPIPLPLDTSPGDVAALEAIAASGVAGGEEQVPDFRALARVLHFSAGITKRLRVSGRREKMPFRAAATTGALYHIELYVICCALPGLEAGVYHYDPQESALRRLRQGDFRGALVAATAGEPAVAHAPAILVYTDVFWRNAYKYQAREYRHAFWDSGTIMANTLAISAASELPATVVAGFVDEEVNHLLDLDPQREFALALVPVGYTPDALPGPAPDAPPLDLKVAPISAYELPFPAILRMHEASSLQDESEVAAWRGTRPNLEMPEPMGQLFPLDLVPPGATPKAPVEEVIVRRGSTREFAREPISFRQLSPLLHRATQPVAADFLEPSDASLNYLYLIANAVDGLPSGAYVYHPTGQALELLQAGSFRSQAGHLALGQDLAADAGVAIFFLTDLERVLARFGNRGYRVGQLEASTRAGKMYLAAYAQGFGATGLTFYDDAVTQFFSPHARGKSVMFLIALGQRASIR
jgi:SagB-type dehydrogenase family enzyme